MKSSSPDGTLRPSRSRRRSISWLPTVPVKADFESGKSWMLPVLDLIRAAFGL